MLLLLHRHPDEQREGDDLIGPWDRDRDHLQRLLPLQPFDQPGPLHLRLPDPATLLHAAPHPARPEQLRLQRHDADGREELGAKQIGEFPTDHFRNSGVGEFLRSLETSSGGFVSFNIVKGSVGLIGCTAASAGLTGPVGAQT